MPTKYLTERSSNSLVEQRLARCVQTIFAPCWPGVFGSLGKKAAQRLAVARVGTGAQRRRSGVRA